MKHKVYKGCLSFDKASLRVGVTGVNMPPPKEFEAYKATFDPPAKDYLQFGWMGNEPNFYGSVTATDAIPKPEDYIDVPFRLISATTVGAGTWKATDFGVDPNLLKNSRKFLEGKGVYKDHETDTNNWVGVIKQVKWTEPFVNDDGLLVPAGIDGILAIDTKVDIKLARGIVSGAIYSNSVTVEFEWRMSHDLSEMDFFNALGKPGADGKQVRRIVTKVLNFHETSLVWLGADPFAKAIKDNGSLKHIDINNVLSYAKGKLGEDKVTYAEETSEKKTYYDTTKNIEINFGIDENVLSLAKHSGPKPVTTTTQQSTNTPTMDKDLQTVFAAFVATFGNALGFTQAPDQMTADTMVAEMKKLSFISEADKGKITAFNGIEGAALAHLKVTNPTASTVDMTQFMKDHTFVGTTELQSYKADNTFVTAYKTAFEVKDGEDLTVSLNAVKAGNELGNASLKMKRDEVVRLYSLSVQTPDPQVVEMYKKADPSTVDGLLKQFTKSATEKFTATCKKCNSHDISFQSAIIEDDAEVKPNNAPVLTTTQIYEQEAQSSMFSNFAEDKK